MANVKPLTKSQIADSIAEAAEITKKQAGTVLAELADLAVRSTKKHKQFTVPGIGKLRLVDRKARMGRNPATGETIRIAAKKAVKFSVSKTAKDAIVPPKKK